jgi:hypothetical protein
MTHKRLKYKFLSYLRSINMLCKKHVEVSKRIRVSKTVYPDGEVVKHGKIEKLPENKHSFESELHVWREIHKETVKSNRKQTPKK